MYNSIQVFNFLVKLLLKNRLIFLKTLVIIVKRDEFYLHIQEIDYVHVEGSP